MSLAQRVSTATPKNILKPTYSPPRYFPGDIHCHRTNERTFATTSMASRKSEHGVLDHSGSSAVLARNSSTMRIPILYPLVSAGKL